MQVGSKREKSKREKSKRGRRLVLSVVWLLSPAVVVVLAESGFDIPADAWATLQHYGALGTIAFVVALIWWKWPTIQDLPGVASFVGWLTDRVSESKHFFASFHRKPPDRFSIAIARLIDDEDRNVEKLIVAGIRDFPGVEILRVDRKISEDGETPTNAHGVCSATCTQML